MLLLTQQVQDDDAAVRDGAVLEQVDSLPGSEGRLAVDDGDGEVSQGQGGADVRGHIVGAFDGVAVEAAVFGGEALEKCFQVVAHVGIRIFLNGERGGGVLDEQSQQPGTESLLAHPGGDFGGDLVEPLAGGGDTD